MANPAGLVQIIDDGSAGFATAGAWTTSTGGYSNDYRYIAKGTGSGTATWTFTGLQVGVYKVSATWMPYSNRATNAPFTILDSTTSRGTVLINQQAAPNDFSDSGVNWENLGTSFTVNSGTLVVKLTNSANNYVIADAVRIEMLGASTAPEIQVLDGATDLPDAAAVNFGSTAVGVPVTKTITVKNTGTSNLTLGSISAMPTGFTLVSNFGSTNLAPNASTTFQVRLNATAAGNFNGPISFTNNDGNESPFDLTLVGTVANPAGLVQIIDDGSAGFATAGAWTTSTGGYSNDYRYIAKGTGSGTATWTFTGLQLGVYKVSATWMPYINRATNAPFTIFNGNTLLATLTINQELAPNDFSDQGVNWKDLGGLYIITSNTLVVKLTNLANEYVIADAIRIERIA